MDTAPQPKKPAATKNWRGIFETLRMYFALIVIVLFVGAKWLLSQYESEIGADNTGLVTPFSSLHPDGDDFPAQLSEKEIEKETYFTEGRRCERDDDREGAMKAYQNCLQYDSPGTGSAPETGYDVLARVSLERVTDAIKESSLLKEKAGTSSQSLADMPENDDHPAFEPETKAHQLDDPASNRWFAIGVDRELVKDTTGAIQAYQKCLATGPGAPECHSLAADALKRLGVPAGP